MKKYLTIAFIIIFISVILFAVWNVVFCKTYKVENIELNDVNVNHIKKTFCDFKLPQGAKIEKASKIVSNGALIYAKVLIPVDKIDEFNNEYQYYKRESLTNVDFEIFKTTKKAVEWWEIDEINADYKINVGAVTSTEFIFCKPKEGLIAVYMKQ